MKLLIQIHNLWICESSIQIHKFKFKYKSTHCEVINSNRVFLDAAPAVNTGREYINTNGNEAGYISSKYMIQIYDTNTNKCKYKYKKLTVAKYLVCEMQYCDVMF